jgi:predicted O-linked N-acetylglucosamine transferase (SPINDLY family)
MSAVVERNAPCPCGSGKKYKKCCMGKMAVVDARLHEALQHQQAGRPVEAERLYREILLQDPVQPQALHRLGSVSFQQGRFAAARDLFQQATVAYARHAPGLAQEHAEAYNNLGLTYLNLGDMAQAQACFGTALEVAPDYPEAHYNYGTALLNQGQWEEAARSFRRAIALRPGYAEAYCNLGTAYGNQDRLEEAMTGFRKAISINPEYAGAYYNLGTVLMSHARYDEAIAQFEQALALRPGYVDAYNNLAALYLAKDEIEQGISCLRKTLELAPNLALAHQNLGLALLRQGRPDAAIDQLDRALGLRPDLATAFDGRLFALNYLPDCDPAALYREHCRYAERFETPLKPLWSGHANARVAERRLKVAYVSPDFRNHSVAFFMEPILAHHDKREVEVYCYYNNAIRDAMTERLMRYADHWIACRRLTDIELAGHIRAEGIDILVDLAGHTAGNRLLAFARKPAPVQVTYLGYPATTGLVALDYRLVSAETDPAGAEAWHSERLYRLPRTLWCYRPAADLPPPATETPARRNGYITFGSMNNLAKVSDVTIQAWVRILETLPGARLALTNLREGSQQLIRERFAAHGLASQRLHLHGRLDRREFYEVLSGIDVALDPFPYAGTTTTCEALWLGIPVISLRGPSSVSRSGHALLKGVGLENLAAGDRNEYIALATGLARNIDRLDTLRAGMRARLATSALSDEAGMARDIETAYRHMWRAWCMQDQTGI